MDSHLGEEFVEVHRSQRCKLRVPIHGGGVMFRALNAVVGGFLFFFGFALLLFGVDGSVPLLVGAGMLAVDLLVERKQVERVVRSRPRFESDRDHMEVQ